MSTYLVEFEWRVSVEVEADSPEEAEAIASETPLLVQVTCPSGNTTNQYYMEGSERYVEELK